MSQEACVDCCIEQRNGGYYVTGTRISLDSVVCAFKRGDSLTRILDRYPLLEKLSLIYGAIAFYLDHTAEIDTYLEASERQFEANCVASSRTGMRGGVRRLRASRTDLWPLNFSAVHSSVVFRLSNAHAGHFREPIHCIMFCAPAGKV